MWCSRTVCCSPTFGKCVEESPIYYHILGPFGMIFPQSSVHTLVGPVCLNEKSNDGFNCARIHRHSSDSHTHATQSAKATGRRDDENELFGYSPRHRARCFRCELVSICDDCMIPTNFGRHSTIIHMCRRIDARTH